MKNTEDRKKIDELYIIAEKVYSATGDKEKVTSTILTHTHDEALTEVVLRYFFKRYFQERRNQGLLYLGIGIVLILLGFFVTFFNFNTNQSFEISMYGFTTLGILISFFGLYKMIG